MKIVYVFTARTKKNATSQKKSLNFTVIYITGIQEFIIFYLKENDQKSDFLYFQKQTKKK